MVIQAHTHIIGQQPMDPANWVITKKFLGKFYTLRTMIEMGVMIEASSKRKQSRFPLSC